MKNFLKLAQNVNVMPLLLAIRQQPELWSEDSYLRKYPQGPFGEVESIMLRFPKQVVFRCKTPEAEERKVAKYKANKLAGLDQHESINYPAWHLLTPAHDIVYALLNTVRGDRLGRVMINKIAPGGRIFPHADTPEHTAYYRRYHVVLQSQPGVVFRAGDEKVYMEPASVWWFDNKQEHEVINNSADDRIHMIVDIHKDGL
jgi:hypothetical protein